VCSGQVCLDALPTAIQDVTRGIIGSLWPFHAKLDSLKGEVDIPEPHRLSRIVTTRSNLNNDTGRWKPEYTTSSYARPK